MFINNLFHVKKHYRNEWLFLIYMRMHNYITQLLKFDFYTSFQLCFVESNRNVAIKSIRINYVFALSEL